MRRKDYMRYGAILLFLVVTFFTIYMLKPFFGSIISAILISFVCYPCYKYVNKYIKSRSWASVVTLLLIVLLLFIPILVLINYIIGEIPQAYAKVSEVLRNTSHGEIESKILNYFGMEVDIANLISQIVGKILLWGQDLLVVLPNSFLHIVLTIFMMFFLFKDGEKMAKKIISVLPFKKKDRQFLVKQVKDVSKGVIYGQIFTALAQGAVATLGYFLIGIKSPIILGLITTFVCLIPYLGAPIIYIPTSAFLILNGLTSDNVGLIVKGIVLLVYGFLVISTVDNFVKPFVVSSHTMVHPGFMVIGMIGGLISFGVVGIVLGPLILVLFFSLISLYEKKKGG